MVVRVGILGAGWRNWISDTRYCSTGISARPGVFDWRPRFRGRVTDAAMARRRGVGSCVMGPCSRGDVAS